MKKRGELTTQQIIMLIILVASFAVLMYFIVISFSHNQTKKEVCHDSVLLRANSISAKAVPLKCRREYVCLSLSGDCDSMVDADVIKVRDKEQTYEKLADLLKDCWWEFGEGKVDYVGGDAWFRSDLYCSICDQVAFDSSLKKIFPSGKIDKKGLYLYMANHKVDKTKTYIDYLGIENIGDLDKRVVGGRVLELGFLDLNKQYFVVMGVFQKKGVVGDILGVAAAGVLFFIPGAGTTALAGIILASIAANDVYDHFAALVVRGAVGNKFISPSFFEVGSKAYNSLGCTSIATLS